MLHQHFTPKSRRNSTWWQRRLQQFCLPSWGFCHHSCGRSSYLWQQRCVTKHILKHGDNTSWRHKRKRFKALYFILFVCSKPITADASVTRQSTFPPPDHTQNRDNHDYHWEKMQLCTWLGFTCHFNEASSWAWSIWRFYVQVWERKSEVILIACLAYLYISAYFPCYYHAQADWPVWPCVSPTQPEQL
jgi:hypothetical protein